MKSTELKKEIKGWIISIGITVIVALLIRGYIFNNTKVMGQSMEPTLEENDVLFTNKMLYYVTNPKRGDVVILKSPDEDDMDYIKRIVAVEGDKIEIKEGKVYVNGTQAEEKYTDENSYTDTMDSDSWVIEEGHVFVLGDNREFRASKDSRSFGMIPIDSIKGKAMFRCYPFNKLGRLK